MRLSPLVVAAVVLLVPAAAHAELTSRVGLDAGGSEIGDRSLSWMGISLGFEHRISRTAAVAAEGSYAGMSDHDEDDPWDGRMLRGAITARALLAGTTGHDEFEMLGWLDVGAGVQGISWSDGGVLYRPELLLGLSGTMGPDFGSGRVGDFLAVHLVISRGPACVRGCGSELQLGFQVSTGLYIGE